jgi:CopG family nickel-responsive transcriptional regulator
MSIEKSLFRKLEKMVARSRYGNRSEFLRDLIREHLVDEEWDSNAESIGTITLIFDHHSRGLGSRLTHTQHHFEGEVLASTHIHLDEHLCAEMIMVRGAASNIKALADRMRREKGVLHASLSTGSTGKSLA